MEILTSMRRPKRFVAATTVSTLVLQASYIGIGCVAYWSMVGIDRLLIAHWTPSGIPG